MARQGVGAGTVAAGFVLVAALGALGLEPAAPDAPVRNETGAAVRTPSDVIRAWPERPRLAARALIDEYGAPDIVDDDSLAWVGNRPWDDTVVRRTAPAGGTIEQSIHYPVSLAKAAELRGLGGRLEYDSSSGQLASSSDSEGLNFLALNLADEVVSGKRTTAQARERYRRTRELAAAGKSSPYTSGFLFTPR